MALQDTSLNPKIFNSAKKEFLKKGFLKASLRSIARDAGVSTGALYRRYKRKEDLFEAVVQPALDLLEKRFFKFNKRYIENINKKEFHKLETSSLELTKELIRELFKEAEAFKLLFGRAEGTKYSNFLDEFAEQKTQVNFDFFEKVKKNKFAKTDITLRELRILSTAYSLTIAKIFIMDFTLEEALSFAERFDNFFNWQVIMKSTN